MTTELIEFKVVLNFPNKDEPKIIRRFRKNVHWKKSFRHLQNIINQLLVEYNPDLHSKIGGIKWQDEDGDYINMYNDQDWKLAIEKGLPKKIIKLHVDCISEE